VLKTLLSTLCRIGFLTAVVAACAAATVSASTFGVNAHVPQEAVADEVVEAGIGWVRIDFQWVAVELERDVYDWKRYDALLDRLEARGLRVYAGLASTPAWATSGSELSGVPDDPDQWQEFCYLAASRYRWRRNSVELSDNEQIEGSDSPRLTMLGLDRHLEGDYDCVITNEAGSVVTRAAHLAVGIAAPRRPADRSIPVVATSKVRMIGR